MEKMVQGNDSINQDRDNEKFKKCSNLLVTKEIQ